MMSRLDQMRQRFLKRVLSEQQYILSQPKSTISCARSVHNISIQSQQLPPQLPRIPTSFQSMQSVNSEYGTSCKGIIKANMPRVKSLNNVCMEQLTRASARRTAIDKQSIETTRNLTLSVNSDVTSSSTNSANVNRPLSTLRPANRYGSRVLSTEQRRTTANSTRNELACKHCDRKFAAKERLDKHTDICEKTRHKQRAVFDSAKQRLNMEYHLPSDQQTVQANGDPSKIPKEMPQGPPSEHILTEKTISEPSTWKSVHQQFLTAIKDAKLRRRAVWVDETVYGDTQCEPVTVTAEVRQEDACIRNCSYCKRKFGMNVIIKHETICGKLFRKKHFNI